MQQKYSPLSGSGQRSGFSLVEVVFALGIAVFAVFALIGLLAVGLQSNHESREQLQAASIVESLCVTRRSAPTADLTTVQPAFPLPALNSGSLGSSFNNFTQPQPIYLTWDGAETSNPDSASFGFLYNINTPASYVPSTAPATSVVYLCIYWPPRANPANASTGHYDLTTTFLLP